MITIFLIEAYIGSAISVVSAILAVKVATFVQFGEVFLNNYPTDLKY